MSQQGRKKSNFPAQTVVPNGSTFDFVSGGVNYKIPAEDFYAALGVTGTLAQAGDPTSTPVLDIQGSVNNIRNLKNGSGIQAAVNANNGITLSHNFTQDPNGVAILRNPTALQPTFLSLFEGDGIGFALDGNQLTISSSTTPALSKVVTVNQLSDFPDPVSGVINLENDTTYLIANDVSTLNRFATASNSAIIGFSPNVGRLTYLGTGTMFTGIDSRLDLRNALFNCPNGRFIDLSETGAGNATLFSMDSCIVENCQTFGTFANLFAVNINNSSALNCSKGAQFAGTGWTLISFNRFAIGSTSATFVGIDLGAVSTDGIEINDLLAVGVAGAVGVSGLPSSGNITAGNKGTLTDCNFIGDITPQGGGLDAGNSIRWVASGNDGIVDTRPDALISVTGNALVTVITASSSNGANAVKANAVWTVEDVSIFTADATGRITYQGETDFRCPIDFTVNIEPVSGTGKVVAAYLAINGVVQVETGNVTVSSGGAQSSVSICWQHTFQTGDYIEIFLENATDVVDLIARRAVGRTN